MAARHGLPHWRQAGWSLLNDAFRIGTEEYTHEALEPPASDPDVLHVLQGLAYIFAPIKSVM